jgi:Flp pilus assembly protein TadG
VRHRQRAQTIGLAAVALIGMVGMLAFVIDAGMLFMAHREAQDAADAAALAGVRDLAQGGTTCSGTCADNVSRYATANYAVLSRLCSDPGTPVAQVGSLNTPKVPTLTVIVSCNASLTFGRILWSAGNSPTFRVQATAVAAIGNAVIGTNGTPTGELADFKDNPSCANPCQVTAVSGTVLSFAGGTFQPDTSALKGYTLQFTDALTPDQTFQIFDNDKTASTIQFLRALPPVPAGSHFTILEHTTRLIH